MNSKKEKILAFEYSNSEICKNYYLNDLETDRQIEMLFDLCQILRANITDIGWKYLFENIGINRMFQIDSRSGWFDTDNEKDWIESVYYNSLIAGYNPIDGNIGRWNEGSNLFDSKDSKRK